MDRNSKVFYLVMCERMICSPFIITTLTTKPLSISILLNPIFREILIYKNQNYVKNSSKNSIFQNQTEIRKTNGRLSWFSNHQYGKIIDTTVKHKHKKLDNNMKFDKTQSKDNNSAFSKCSYDS